VDEDQNSIYVSPQVRDLIGIEPEVWLSDFTAWRNHVHADDIQRAWDEYQEAYTNHLPLNHEYRMVHEDGTVRWVLEQAFPIDDEQGNPWLIQGVIFDITERKSAEEQVTFLAYHDKLTGLPNRALFEEMLESALARARRFDLGVGVLFLDLDNFKLVNDSLGHEVGDHLITQISLRLQDATRDTDLVARPGGDEFLMLLADLDQTSPVVDENGAAISAQAVAHRVLEAFEAPFEVDGTELYVTASIGISVYPLDAADATSLLRNSDSAVYLAKETGPGGYVLNHLENDGALSKLSLSTRLRKAVEQEE
jgi:diguanylate cyclase (GGDEF)-like protein/PAS domain S-box-containing protein